MDGEVSCQGQEKVLASLQKCRAVTHVFVRKLLTGKGFVRHWASAKQGHALAKPFPGHQNVDRIFAFLVAALESEGAESRLHRFLTV